MCSSLLNFRVCKQQRQDANLLWSTLGDERFHLRSVHEPNGSGLFGPAHALNVFVPLKPLTWEDGPTQFTLGTCSSVSKCVLCRVWGGYFCCSGWEGRLLYSSLIKQSAKTFKNVSGTQRGFCLSLFSDWLVGLVGCLSVWLPFCTGSHLWGDVWSWWENEAADQSGVPVEDWAFVDEAPRGTLIFSDYRTGKKCKVTSPYCL